MEITLSITKVAFSTNRFSRLIHEGKEVPVVGFNYKCSLSVGEFYRQATVFIPEGIEAEKAIKETLNTLINTEWSLNL